MNSDKGLRVSYVDHGCETFWHSSKHANLLTSNQGLKLFSVFSYST